MIQSQYPRDARAGQSVPELAATSRCARLGYADARVTPSVEVFWAQSTVAILESIQAATTGSERKLCRARTLH